MSNTYDMNEMSMFEASEKTVEARNNKILAAVGAGLAGGVAVTALSPKSSTTSTVVTAAYAAARGYLIYDELEAKKPADVRAEVRRPGSTKVTNKDLAFAGLSTLVDVAAVGYISSFLLGE